MAEVLDAHLCSRAGWALARLTEASRVVDDMWREALAAGGTEEAMDLAEASQGIHRALISLAPHSPKMPQSRSFTVDWG